MNGGMMNSSMGDHDSSRDRSVRRVIIKQVNNLVPDDDGYTLDGAPFKNAIIVGTLSSVEHKEKRTVVVMTDGTGEVRVNLWDNGQNRSLETGKYASAYIDVRNYNDKISVGSSNIIQPIPYDQVLYHQMVALKDHLDRTGGGSGAGATSKNGATEPKSEDGLFSNNIFGEEEHIKARLLDTLDTDNSKAVEFLAAECQVDAAIVENLLKELENDGRVWNDGEGLWSRSSE